MQLVTNLIKMFFIVLLCLGVVDGRLFSKDVDKNSDKCQKVFLSQDLQDTKEVDELIGFISEKEPFIGNLFSMPVGVEDGYTLREHINYMFIHYKMYFSNLDQSVNRFMSLISVLHDIGKPISAVIDRNDIQLEYTMSVISDFNVVESLVKEGKFLLDQCQLGIMIMSGGLGRYFQNEISLDQIIENIKQKAFKVQMSPCRFLYLLTVYYQCDAGSYTHEVGAKPRLEHLFTYNKDEDRKVFLEDRGRLKFSDKLEMMYRDIERRLECRSF